VSAISRSTDTVTAKTVSAGGLTTVNLTIANPGTISGVVRDGSLNPVPSAQIVITGGGKTVGTTADFNGNYASAGLLAGSYTVTTSAAGFPDSVNNNVVVVTDSVTTLNIQMAASGPAWYNGAWTNRRKITINHLKVASGVDLLNFPMLMSVTDAELKTVGSGGKVGKSDGTDILFTAGDGTTKLNHELESYSGSAGSTAAWVRIPSVSASVDTVVYVYFGNTAAADQQNKTGSGAA